MKLMKSVLAGALICTASVMAATQPNILFFAVDDMNDWIGPMGYEQAVTPNIDRLAKAGVTFINGHTAGIYCAPSRAAIFSGRYASSTGCYTSALYYKAEPDLRPLQVVLQDGGYATYGAGKLFHHPAGMIDQRGWDEFYLRTQKQKETGWPMDTFQQEDADLIPQPFPGHSKYKRSEGNPTEKSAIWFLEWGKVPDEKENEMADTMRADWAANLLRQKHDKPFFVGIGVYAPHFPNFCPAKYFDLYDRDQIVPPPYKKDDLDDLPEKVRRAKTGRGRIHDHLEEIDAVKDAIHGYLACLSYADAMLGRLLDALEEGPNADNTIVVFWSDHGYHHGEKKDWGKHTLWERTSNVPFIWAGPGIAVNEKIEAGASLVDMFPTLVEFAGVNDGQERDGVSLVSMLGNPAAAKDRDIFLPGMKPNEYAVMNRNWRYIRYADGSEELYNVREDPNEWHNLAGHPEMEDVKKKLASSAPETFAEPLKQADYKLVVDGEGFSWEHRAEKDAE